MGVPPNNVHRKSPPVLVKKSPKNALQRNLHALVKKSPKSVLQRNLHVLLRKSLKSALQKNLHVLVRKNRKSALQKNLSALQRKSLSVLSAIQRNGAFKRGELLIFLYNRKSEIFMDQLCRQLNLKIRINSVNGRTAINYCFGGMSVGHFRREKPSVLVFILD